MNSNRVLAVMFFFMLAACNANPSPEEIEKKLSSTMRDNLYKEHGNDSTNVKFRIDKVIYYNDVDYYDCEFTVFMSVKNGKDTSGIMQARISKDFKKVIRTQ